MIGDFTSSGIGDLMKVAKNKIDFGAPALAYIEEKRFEKKLGRSLSKDHNARPTSWGNLCEIYFYTKKELPLSVEVLNKVRFRHKELNWSGSPDGLDGDMVIDLKSPFTMKSFCQLSECKTGEDLLALNHLYFWQLISNSILIEQERGIEVNNAKLIVFCPQKRELYDIREVARTTNLLRPSETRWLEYAEDDELPYLVEGSEYKSIYELEFEIKQEWKDALIENVKKALNYEI
jgi:hypothetical protein